jgi:hypothetical protein
VAWLASLEPFAIVERYNAVLRGLSNFYTEFVKTPSTQISRWIYIIRYSCPFALHIYVQRVKTLAQKYRISIRKLLLKYKAPRNPNVYTKEKTVAFTVIQTVGGTRCT